MSYLERYYFKDFIQAGLKKSKNEVNAQQPRLSVIVPSYNQAEYLERTLLSILNQNYANLQLLVVDGGSTDGSLGIIKKYESYIDRWVSEKDKGQVDAINKGLAWANGDLVCFQNSDDLFAPNALNTLAEFYKKQPEYDGYYGDMLFIDEHDHVTDILKTVNFSLEAQVLEGMQIFNQSFFFKPICYKNWGGMNESLQFVLDYEMVLRWAHKGAVFAKVEGFLGAFRLHSLAKTANMEAVRKKEHEALSAQYAEILGLTGKAGVLLKTIRIKKMLYFLKKLDFSYLAYRLAKK